ncbi:MAG: T9SS type A sorting domain-containing protein [Bacteroidaceae bacterium]|nr:T9SS type A sorting domain-containing protein [Bacteroidaceae bacterium]
MKKVLSFSRRSFLLGGLCLSAFLPASADDSYLWFYAPSPTQNRAFAVDDIGKLTFTDAAVIVHPLQGGESVSLPYESIQRLAFGAMPTAIENAVSPVEGLQVDYHPATQTLSITSEASPSSAYRVYNVQGRLVLNGRVEGVHTVVDVAVLPMGVYIARVGNVSLKFYKQ